MAALHNLHFRSIIIEQYLHLFRKVQLPCLILVCVGVGGGGG